MRSMGEIIQDLEDLIAEMVDVNEQDLQKGDVLALVSNYIDVHYPGAIEEYEDGSHPIYFYGPKELLERLYLKPNRVIVENGCRVEMVNENFVVTKGKM